MAFNFAVSEDAKRRLVRLETTEHILAFEMLVAVKQLRTEVRRMADAFERRSSAIQGVGALPLQESAHGSDRSAVAG